MKPIIASILSLTIALSLSACGEAPLPCYDEPEEVAPPEAPADAPEAPADAPEAPAEAPPEAPTEAPPEAPTAQEGSDACTEWGMNSHGQRFCLSTTPVACPGPWPCTATSQ